MGERSASPNSSFTSAMTLIEEGLTYVPKRYILPPSLRPDGTLCNTCLPIVDLSNLQHPLIRSHIIRELHLACKEFGFFQVLFIVKFHVTCNRALAKTSLLPGFLGLVSCTSAFMIYLLLSIHKGHEDIVEGSQVMAVNCYPVCPEPDLTLGLPPHTDYGMISIILQNHQGLQIMDQDKKWHSVPLIEGALIVMLGDHMEVLSNGIYKSIVHRATVNSEKKRISIASLHSLALDKKVGPASALVNEQNILSKESEKLIQKIILCLYFYVSDLLCPYCCASSP